MDLVQLERFVEVASSGSLRKAARRLGLSQPTLTWSIHQLEASVRGQLFERHGRGSRLTDAGRALLPHAQLLINEGRRALSAVETLQGARDPEITVAATPPFTAHLIPDVIGRVTREIPRLRVHLTQSDSVALIEGVRSGEFDVAFVNPRQGADLAGIDFEKLYVERYSLAARADHPIFEGRGPIGLEHVTRYGWAMHRGSLTRDPDSTPFARAGLPQPTIRSFVTSEHLLRPLILATDLLGYVAHDLVRRELREGTIRAIELDDVSAATPAGLLVRQGATYTPAMRTFCRELRLVCRRRRSPEPGAR